MPYKDKEDQRAANRIWWGKNKEKENKKRYEKKKLLQCWFREYKKTLSCVNCEETHPACVEFHHLKEKKKEVSTMVRSGGYAQKTIEEEIAKCIPLCANCHRKEHYEKKRACPNSNRDYDAPNVV